MNKLLLDLQDFVRVQNLTGEEIRGRYDGVEYTFPDGQDGSYLDVHRAVAQHILGFMLPDKSDDKERMDKIPVLHRLGWLSDSTTLEAALRRLRKVSFHEIPAFPVSMLPTGRQVDESAGRVPSPPMGQGAPDSTPAGSGAPQDPLPVPKDPFATPKRAAK